MATSSAKPVPVDQIIREDSGPSVTDVPKKAPNEDNTVNRLKERDTASNDLKETDRSSLSPHQGNLLGCRSLCIALNGDQAERPTCYRVTTYPH